MRRGILVLGLASLAMLALGCAGTGAASAETIQRPNLAPARTAFAGLSQDDRIGLHLLLIATGDFNAMVSDTLGGRLDDAVARFQARAGLLPTGIPDPATLRRLRAEGGPILAGVGLHSVNHPSAEASLFVLGAFGLVASPTPRGLAFETADHAMSLDVSFFPAAQTASPHSHILRGTVSIPLSLAERGQGGGSECAQIDHVRLS